MFRGKKVAFVASGGGGRAIAHAGVMRACQELGIEFDLLVGASAGAIGAIYYSFYKDPDMIVDHFRPFWKRKYKFPQFGWSKMITMDNFFSRRMKSGLFDLGKAEQFLRETLPTDDFNKLPIPVYIAATSLEDHEGVLFGPNLNDNIPISKALMASCCLPILFRPVKINGKHFVDGEIKRPLSIDTAIDLGADVVIVSDIYKPHITNIGDSSMINIFSQIVNMLLEDKSMRGVKICSSNYPDKEIILVSPPVGNFSAFNTYAYNGLESSGYITATQILKDHLDLKIK